MWPIETYPSVSILSARMAWHPTPFNLPSISCRIATQLNAILPQTITLDPCLTVLYNTQEPISRPNDATISCRIATQLNAILPQTITLDPCLTVLYNTQEPISRPNDATRTDIRHFPCRYLGLVIVKNSFSAIKCSCAVDGCPFSKESRFLGVRRDFFEDNRH